MSGKRNKPLSDKAYLKHGGTKCPYCKAEDTVESVDNMDVDGDVGWQSVRCTKCDKRWTDHWKLCGYAPEDA